MKLKAQCFVVGMAEREKKDGGKAYQLVLEQDCSLEKVSCSAEVYSEIKKFKEYVLELELKEYDGNKYLVCSGITSRC